MSQPIEINNFNRPVSRFDLTGGAKSSYARKMSDPTAVVENPTGVKPAEKKKPPKKVLNPEEKKIVVIANKQIEEAQANTTKSVNERAVSFALGLKTKIEIEGMEGWDLRGIKERREEIEEFLKKADAQSAKRELTEIKHIIAAEVGRRLLEKEISFEDYEGIMGLRGGADAPPTPPPVDTEPPHEVNADKYTFTAIQSFAQEIRTMQSSARSGHLDMERYRVLFDRIAGASPPDGTDAVRFAIEKDQLLTDFRLALHKYYAPLFEKEAQGRESKEDRDVTNKLKDGLEAIIGADVYDSKKLFDLLRNSFTLSDPYTFPTRLRLVQAMILDDTTGQKDIKEMENKKTYIYEDAMEFLLELFLSTPDENPHASYTQFNFTQQQNLDAAMENARLYSNRYQTLEQGFNPKAKHNLYNYFVHLKGKRYTMHELWRTMKDEKTYEGIFTQLLRMGGLDFVENDIVGVAPLQIAYEKALSSKAGMTEHMLRRKEMGEVDSEVKEYLKQLIATGKIKKDLYDVFGKEKKGERSLGEWEENRARLVGRSLNAATMRRMVFGVLGELVSNTNEEFLATELEFIERIVASIKLVAGRYLRQDTAQLFLDQLDEFVEEAAKRSGDTYVLKQIRQPDGSIKEVAFYGKTPKAMRLLQTGASDLRSSGYRQRAIYLNNQEFKNKKKHNRQAATMYQYLVEQERMAKLIVNGKDTGLVRKLRDEHDHYSDQELHQLWEHHAYLSDREVDALAVRKYKKNGRVWEDYKHVVNDEFHHLIEKEVANQPLFLGVLLKYSSGTIGGIGEKNKEAIWKNIVQYLPSKTAALLPEEAREIIGQVYDIAGTDAIDAQWNQVKAKIWLLEQERVRKQAEDIRANGTTDTLGKPLLSFAVVGLTEQERQLIERLVALGEQHAEIFAKQASPFTIQLEDAPSAQWTNLTDEDIDRYRSDSSDTRNGMMKLMQVIGNPASKPEVVIKAYEEAFQSLAGALGVGSAQETIEPFVSAFISMAQMNGLAKWFGAPMDILRIPRSLSEKHNLQGNIIEDEAGIRGLLQTFAQHEIIADNPFEIKVGQTQMQRMLERHEANWRRLLYMYARQILLLMGPVMGLAFLKMVLPDDAVKSLQLK